MNAYAEVNQIKLVQNDEDFSVASFMVAGKKVWIAQCNKDFEKNNKHVLQINNEKMEWVGPYAILYNGEKL